MRKNRIILIFLVFFGTGLALKGQDPVPKLIISEIHMYHTEEAYVEITNMGDQPVDLSRVIFAAARTSGFSTGTLNSEIEMLTDVGFLDPGESFVVINHRTSSSDTTNILTPSWYYEKANHMLYAFQQDGVPRRVHGTEESQCRSHKQ